MSDTLHKNLDKLKEAVLASRKYRHISLDLINYLGAQELARGASLKEALKATKNKLHQVGGAYLPGELRYSSWLAELRLASQQHDQAELRRACIDIMQYHTSTRERLPILEHFYTTVLAGLPPLNTVIDIACGLHPLAIPWMSLPQHMHYYAYDIYRDGTNFLTEFLRLIHVAGEAQACDVIQHCPTRKADLAFILKTIPCLEQIDKSAGWRLLDTINADVLLISFPVHSLSGKHKGMAFNYETHFRELVAGRHWLIERFEFTSELVFRVAR